MEKLSDAEKAQFTEGLRAAATQAEDTFKVVAVLRALGDDIPAGTRINGEDIRALVADLEKRGIILPTTGISAVEVRNLRSKVALELPKISLRGIPFKGKGKAPATYDADTDLKQRIRQQEQEFELYLLDHGDSIEKLDARIAEARDPLMKLVNVRNPKRK